MRPLLAYRTEEYRRNLSASLRKWISAITGKPRHTISPHGWARKPT